MGEHHPATSYSDAEPDPHSDSAAGCVAVSCRHARCIACTDVCLPVTQRESVAKRNRLPDDNAIAVAECATRAQNVSVTKGQPEGIAAAVVATPLCGRHTQVLAFQAGNVPADS